MLNWGRNLRLATQDNHSNRANDDYGSDSRRFLVDFPPKKSIDRGSSSHLRLRGFWNLFPGFLKASAVPSRMREVGVGMEMVCFKKIEATSSNA